MAAILQATAQFKPSANAARLLALYVEVKVFSKVQRSQQVVVDEAKAICPTASGELQGSIAAGEIVNDGRRIIGPVVASSGHASFVEFGTGLRGEGTYPYDLPQENVPITGSWEYDYKQQNWEGMPSQPFLRPALDNARSQVLAEFES